MVSSRIMIGNGENKPNESVQSFQEELEIERSMRSAAIIDHHYEPENISNCEVLNVFNPVDAGTHTDMIHIEVPDTKTLVEKSDGTSKYIAYNIEINGWKHASVRFSVLYEFSEMIRTKFGKKYKGPEFPSKKLFKLDVRSIDDRRVKIKKYFQALVQHPEIARHYLVEKQLLGFQVESYRATSSSVSVDVYLGDGEKVQIKCNVGANTADVMKIIAEKLGFSTVEHLQWNFGLFIARSRDSTITYSINSESFDPLIIRLLRNFEAPYISLSTMNRKSVAEGLYHFLCLRKTIWDPKAENLLLDNEQIVDLFYRQAVQEMKLGFFGELKFEHESKLKTHRNDKVQFLRTCQQIPGYSYERLGECFGDYPKPRMVSTVKVGHRQLVIKFTDDIIKVLVHQYDNLWYFLAVPLLFSLVGYTFDFSEISKKDLQTALVLIAIGSVCRFISAMFISFLGGFNISEQLILSLSLMPKATVQCALAPSLILLTDNFPELRETTKLIIYICIISVMITSPIVEILLDLLAPRILKKTHIFDSTSPTHTTTTDNYSVPQFVAPKLNNPNGLKTIPYYYYNKNEVYKN